MNRTTKTDALLDSLRAQLAAAIEEERAEARAAESHRALSPLPPGTPLLADNSTAPALFSLSVTTLEALRRRYPDFPAIKVGGKILYNTYRVWEWVDTYPDRVIELQ
ncbi:MAG: hypothetical protein IJH38_04345 [Clostridia bacterium]|nr:hypothetical protein [Clostridia bacterium]